MVSVGKLSAGQARYYLDQAAGPVTATKALTSGVEDYYLGGPEAAGRWLGRGALALGLDGRVEEDDLHDVLAGGAPVTGETLRARGSVAGFDVTFSAPKSVSVLFGVGDPATQTAIHVAHARAVDAAFEYFERSTAFARRGAGGARVVDGDGLVAAAFVHRTSRAGDPQLHTHVLVANLVRARDGRWSALDGRLVYAHARTAGFLYQAELRAELTRTLGLAWTPVSKGSAEIRGVSHRVIRAFSQRRVEIEAAMELHGSSGRHAAQVAALDTRRAKVRTVRPEALTPEWRRRAVGLGLDASRIGRLLGRQTLPEPVYELAFNQLAAPTGLTQNRSTFGRRDVLQALCDLAGQGAAVHDLERAAAESRRIKHSIPRWRAAPISRTSNASWSSDSLGTATAWRSSSARRAPVRRRWLPRAKLGKPPGYRSAAAPSHARPLISFARRLASTPPASPHSYAAPGPLSPAPSS
jgi:conjugative relaxase-like TrwC/TraI family protein